MDIYNNHSNDLLILLLDGAIKLVDKCLIYSRLLILDYERVR